MIITDLIPSDLPLYVAAGLVIFSFFTSAITAAFGIGGGVMMLAALASFLPPLAIIPTHGAVQLGSNAGRTAVMRKSVNWRLFLFFVVGALVGGIAASQLVVALPRDVLRLILGIFILWTVWGPKLHKFDVSEKGFSLVGVVSTFATMFVGATGPLIAACLPTEKLGRLGTVGTHGACMTIQHAIKVSVFAFIGFGFLEWLPLILAMVAFGFLGTLIGKKILERLPEQYFRNVFRAILTILALRLIWVAGATFLV